MLKNLLEILDIRISFVFLYQ